METSSDVKEVPTVAVSQATEHVEGSILHYQYTFHVVITCCLQRRMFHMKVVRSHPLKFELLRGCCWKKNEINML